jgi:acetylornithine/N-succinyldiaminopimelate aminotransferase
MGMCLATEAAASGMGKGAHGSTFGGNPLAMAVGNAVLDVMTAPGFLEQVRRVAGVFTQGLESLRGRYPRLVTEITGRGLLRGIKLTQDPMPLRAALMERRMLVGTAGDRVLRLAPPLIVSEADVREAVSHIDAELGVIARAQGG